jgi:MFS family permease
VGLFGAGDFAHSMLTLRAAQMLTPKFGAGQAGQIAIALYIIHNILYACMSYPIGALGDRYGKRVVLALGYALAGLMGIGCQAEHKVSINQEHKRSTFQDVNLSANLLSEFFNIPKNT